MLAHCLIVRCVCHEAARSSKAANRGKGTELDKQDQPFTDAQGFDPREMDKIIRQVIDKVRGNYLQNGDTARGMPSEVKRIIENSIDRI